MVSPYKRAHPTPLVARPRQPTSDRHKRDVYAKHELIKTIPFSLTLQLSFWFVTGSCVPSEPRAREFKPCELLIEPG